MPSKEQKKLLTRGFSPSSIKMRSEGELNALVGNAIVYNTVQNRWGYREQIAPGSATESLEGDKRIHALWQHDRDEPLAHNQGAGLTLEDTTEALRAHIVPVATQRGKDLVEAVRSGLIDGMSFGFYPIEERMNENEEGEVTITVTRMELLEVSPVTYPFYEATTLELNSRSLKERLKPLVSSEKKRDELHALAMYQLRKRQIEVMRLTQ